MTKEEFTKRILKDKKEAKSKQESEYQNYRNKIFDKQLKRYY